jgi:hypothetical protein
MTANDKTEAFLSKYGIQGHDAATIRQSIARLIQAARFNQEKLEPEQRYTTAHAKRYVKQYTELSQYQRQQFAYLVDTITHETQHGPGVDIMQLSARW